MLLSARFAPASAAPATTLAQGGVCMLSKKRKGAKRVKHARR